MRFSENLKLIRHQKQMTQTAVADKLHVSRKTISSWENERSYPDILMLVKISDVYDITLDNLMKEDLGMLKQYEVQAATSRRSARIKLITAYLNIGLLFLIYLNHFFGWQVGDWLTLVLLINLIVLGTTLQVKTRDWLPAMIILVMLLVLNFAIIWPLRLKEILPAVNAAGYEAGYYTASGLWILIISLSGCFAALVHPRIGREN